MASSTALNLEAIQKAIDQHNGGPCPFPVIQIVMAPFEVERLGFDNFNGIPIVGDENMPTGRFRLVCEGVDTGDFHGVKEEVEAPAPAERELIPAGPAPDKELTARCRAILPGGCSVCGFYPHQSWCPRREP